MRSRRNQPASQKIEKPEIVIGNIYASNTVAINDDKDEDGNVITVYQLKFEDPDEMGDTEL
jgi:hypothetical protein